MLNFSNIECSDYSSTHQSSIFATVAAPPQSIVVTSTNPVSAQTLSCQLATTSSAFPSAAAGNFLTGKSIMHPSFVNSLVQQQQQQQQQHSTLDVNTKCDFNFGLTNIGGHHSYPGSENVKRFSVNNLLKLANHCGDDGDRLSGKKKFILLRKTNG